MRYTGSDLMVFCVLSVVVATSVLGVLWAMSADGIRDSHCSACGGTWVAGKCLLIESIDIE